MDKLQSVYRIQIEKFNRRHIVILYFFLEHLENIFLVHLCCYKLTMYILVHFKVEFQIHIMYYNTC